MPSRKVLLRDFLIFQLKLVLDGIKDSVLFFVAIVAVLIDLVLRTKGQSRFYRVLEVGERFELWLNLHRAASRVGQTDDGLFGVSRAGSDSLLGKIEQVVRGGDQPRSKR